MADPNTPEIPEIKQRKTYSVPPTPILSGLKGEVGNIPGMSGAPTYEERAKLLPKSTDVAAEEARVLGSQNQLSEDIGLAQQAEKQYLSEAEYSIASQTREQAQDIEAGLELVREKFPYPEFKPTQENMQSLATLFSLVGVIGVAMGGEGKMSAMGSLNAMTGMMKGWQQGRKDLWEKEKLTFDKNMAKTKAILDDAYKDADRAYKTMAYNREEAIALANQSAAKLGGQVGKQMLQKQGLGNFFEFLKSLKKDLTHAEDIVSQRAVEQARIDAQVARDTATRAYQDKRDERIEAARDKRHREDMAQRDRLAALKASQPKGQGSAANTRYAFTMSESFGQTAQDLVNVSNMPKGTVMGNFAELAGKSGDSLKQGLSAAFGRKITDQDSRMFSQLVAGLDQNMARTLGGGYANSTAKHAIEAYKQQIPREGDSPAVVAMFLARFKQELGIFADVFSAHPGANEQMTGKVNKYMDMVNKAIPFNVNDVLAATRNSRITTGQQFENLATPQGNVDLPVDTGQAPAAAPAVRTPKLNGRAIEVRNNKWVYSDTGEEAK
jgi:sulfopyruvate decarboxylase TPP-binding subunit